MLFLTEQDVKDALSGGDAYKEAVAVIERVLAQQSAGTTHHLKRTTMAHPEPSRASLAQYSHTCPAWRRSSAPPRSASIRDTGEQTGRRSSACSTGKT